MHLTSGGSQAGRALTCSTGSRHMFKGGMACDMRDEPPAAAVAVDRPGPHGRPGGTAGWWARQRLTSHPDAMDIIDQMTPRRSGKPGYRGPFCPGHAMARCSRKRTQPPRNYLRCVDKRLERQAQDTHSRSTRARMAERRHDRRAAVPRTAEPGVAAAARRFTNRRERCHSGR